MRLDIEVDRRLTSLSGKEEDKVDVALFMVSNCWMKDCKEIEEGREAEVNDAGRIGENAEKVVSGHAGAGCCFSDSMPS